MRSTQELIEAAVANVLQAVQILKHAALESQNSEDASEFWLKASQLEGLAESLSSSAKTNPKNSPRGGDKKK